MRGETSIYQVHLNRGRFEDYFLFDAITAIHPPGITAQVDRVQDYIVSPSLAGNFVVKLILPRGLPRWDASRKLEPLHFARLIQQKLDFPRLDFPAGRPNKHQFPL